MYTHRERERAPIYIIVWSCSPSNVPLVPPVSSQAAEDSLSSLPPPSAKPLCLHPMGMTIPQDAP